jgi:hypothetical protein
LEGTQSLAGLQLLSTTVEHKVIGTNIFKCFVFANFWASILASLRSVVLHHFSVSRYLHSYCKQEQAKIFNIAWNHGVRNLFTNDLANTMLMSMQNEILSPNCLPSQNVFTKSRYQAPAV